MCDTNYPFHHFIPHDHWDDYENTASIENLTHHIQKPKLLGDFAVLYQEKKRMQRVLTVVRFVESREACSMTTDEAPRLHKNRTLEEMFTELSPVPIDLVSTPQVTALREFNSKTDAYPVCYRSERIFHAIDDPQSKSCTRTTRS